MAEPFNAYHKWLGIVSEEFPPSHYRLLGIPQFESDPVVIEHAADQRMAHLRTLQTGQHAAMSQKLLNEIAAARVCLLTPEKKAAYDAKLREQSAAVAPREVSPQPMPTAAAWGSSTQPIDDAASLTATVEWSALGQLGEYKLLEKLGEGGMGAVFKALHTKLGRVVALKVIRQERKWDQRAIARFEREMQAVGALDHPNIIRAFDARDVGGTRLLAMEFVEGMDLAGIVHHHHELPIADACEIVRQAAVALECAHQHELVHRDIKPSNLMLNRQGCVKLLDLGLARFEISQTAEEVTASDQAVGTIEYMAPEQFSDSRSVDIRADIYSLGCTFYKLLTGQAPFGGPEYPGTVERLMALASKPIPNVQRLRDDIPKELTRILNRMLAKTPAQRFSTPGEVADALGPFCIGANLPELLAKAEGRSSPDEASQAFQPTPEVISSGLTRFLEQTGIRRFKLPSSARPAAKHNAKRMALQFGLTSLGVALLVCLLLLATRTPATKPVEDQPKAATAAVRQSFLILDWPAADRSDCKLYIDASPYERIRATKDAPDQVKVPLTPGNHTIRIIRRDFEPFVQSVSIVAEKDTPLKPEWKPISAPSSTPPVAPPEAAKHPLRTLHPLKLPKLTYGNWFPLLTSPNELVGLNRIDPGADYSYSNGLLEVRKDGLWCGAVIKDGGIRAKVKLGNGPVYLALRRSDRGCYAASFPCNQSFTLFAIIDDVAQTVTSASVESPKTYDGWFDLEFSAVGDKLTVLANGERILEAHDSTYAQGLAGLGTWNGDNQFRKIELLIPNKESLVGDASDPSVKDNENPTAASMPSGETPPLAVAPFDEAQAKEHQKRWAEYFNVPVEQTNSIGMKMMLIPPGEFIMGTPKELIEEELRQHDGGTLYREAIPHEGPQHRVRITKPYWLGTTAVTQEDYQRVMGNNPSVYTVEPKNPVENVLWKDAVEFCRKLSELPAEKAAQRRYCLPTEAQWEYACRAGSAGRWCFNGQQNPAPGKSQEDILSEYGWIKKNSGMIAHPVGQKLANAWGLYDMHGNTFDWCQDWYGEDYYEKSPLDDPTGPNTGSLRVDRGACYAFEWWQSRSSFRGAYPAEQSTQILGFRVAQTLVYENKPKLTPKPSEPPAAKVERTAKVDKAAEARLAAALAPADKLIAAWDFQGAAAELAKVQAEGPDDSAQLAARRATVERMGTLKDRMIEKIKKADPPIKKNAILLRGQGGELVHADQKSIQAKLANGETESHDWRSLTPKSRQKLLQLVIDRASADDWLAVGTLGLYSQDMEFAERCFARAQSLGAKIDVHIAPLLSALFSQAKQLLDDKQFAKAQAGLAHLETQYGDTAWYQKNRQTIEPLHQQANAGHNEAEAERLYARAAKLFEQHEWFDLKPVVDKLKASYANSRAVTAPARKPSMAEMAKVVSKLGNFVTVRQDGKGDFKRIQSAINAAPPYSLIEIQDNGPYYEQLHIRSDTPGLMVRGQKSCFPSIIEPPEANKVLQVDARDAVVQRVALLLVGAPRDGQGPAFCIGTNNECSFRSVIFGSSRDGWTGLDTGQICEFDTCFFGCFNTSMRIASPVVIRNCVFSGSKPEQGFLIGYPGAATGIARLQNTFAIEFAAHATCEISQCTTSGIVDLQADRSSIINSIIGSVISNYPMTQLEYCHVSGKYADHAKPGKNCQNGDPMFADPKNFDFRLLPKSPCRKKASDGGDIGAHYTPEMLEIMQVAFELRRRGLIKF